MVITRTRRKIIVVTLEINKLERFKPFEIKLPANVKKVSGILVTISAK